MSIINKYSIYFFIYTFIKSCFCNVLPSSDLSERKLLETSPSLKKSDWNSIFPYLIFGLILLLIINLSCFIYNYFPVNWRKMISFFINLKNFLKSYVVNKKLIIPSTKKVIFNQSKPVIITRTKSISMLTLRSNE